MENVSINITKRKDGRYMGKFIIGCEKMVKLSINMFMDELMMKPNTRF